MIDSTTPRSVGSRDAGKLLRCGASLTAICVFALAGPAYAQMGASAAGAASESSAPAMDDAGQSAQESVPNSDPGAGAPAEDVVVTGIRQSLANAQSIKRNADTVVDAITAQDIGALPDRSVTEALQRVPGVSINRFAGSNDPDHFSVEGSGVVVRGLTYVRSEFNGRDTFSTGVYGQAINFADVPSELLGSVEVYKNATAEMIEGGLSGTVNLNTRVPFQRKGFRLGVDVQANYGDMRKEMSPTASLLVSNTWETGIGTIGLLGNVSYSQVLSEAHGVQVANFQTRDNTLAVEANSGDGGVLRCRNPLPMSTDSRTLPVGQAFCPGTAGVPAGSIFAVETPGADGFGDYMPVAYAPLGGQYRTQDYNRERIGLAGAFQWESLDRRALLTAQFLRTESTQKWGEHTFESAPDLSEYNTYPYGCRPNENGPDTITPGGTNPARTTRAQCPIGGVMPLQNYVYDSDNVFESGYITLPGVGWRATDSGGTWRTPTGGMQQSLSRRQVDDENIVSDYGLNLKFTPNERWQINLDAQYVRAEHNNLDVSVFGSTFADQELDLTGNLPQVVTHKPLWLSADWSGCTPAAGMAAGTCSPNARINGQNDQQYFSDPGNYYWRAAMDHVEASRGEEVALRADVAYNFGDDGFLKRVKFGARYADRDQNIQFTSYNWGVLSETWGGGGPQWMDTVQPGRAVFYDFPNFFRGDTPGPIGGYYFAGDLIKDYRSAGDVLQGIAAGWNNPGQNLWEPVSERAGVVPGTDYLPDELQQVSERTVNAYAMLSFGSDDAFGSTGFSGNIGVRYVDTAIKSVGAFRFPSRGDVGVGDPFDVRCAPRAVNSPPAPEGTPPQVPGGICTLGPAGYAQLQAFASGASTPSTAKQDYQYFLPSLNLKLDLTDTLIARFAASRALARPGMQDIRNFFNFGTNNNDPTRLQGTAGNPYLKPAISDQFDVTLEWYFARVGSLTLNGFYKNIKNFFYQNVVPYTFTSNGVSLVANIRQQDNFDGSGKVKGFEVAYQQTLDFLPGALNGLGVNANYTYIDSKGLPSNRPVLGPATNLTPNALPLEQLSKHNVNVSVFYEKGPVSLRAAYNWRSRFLLTSSDVIHPFYPVFNDETGQLDASAFFNVSDFLKIGVQGVNLTNEVTKTLQQFTPDGKLGPRSYFMNDRRFSFIVRASF